MGGKKEAGVCEATATVAGMVGAVTVGVWAGAGVVAVAGCGWVETPVEGLRPTQKRMS